jgi:hypothetical protein
MIDVVQALELFESCAADMAEEDAGTGHRRKNLTARALTKGQIHRSQLSGFPPTCLPTAVRPVRPGMTLGALIVFRTADKFGRAGASPARTIDALYRAVQRYVEVLPRSLLDRTDSSAVDALIFDERRETSGVAYSRPCCAVTPFRAADR